MKTWVEQGGTDDECRQEKRLIFFGHLLRMNDKRLTKRIVSQDKPSRRKEMAEDLKLS